MAGRSRAPKGSNTGKPLLLRLPQWLRDAAAGAAESLEISEAEWWRQIGEREIYRLQSIHETWPRAAPPIPAKRKRAYRGTG